MSDGGFGVMCPRCCEVIQPIESPLFDGADCTDCGQVIPLNALKNYKKAMRELEERDAYDPDGGDYV